MKFANDKTWLFCILFVSMMMGAFEACANDQNRIVQTDDGRVSGGLENGIAFWKGIRFAAPPVGVNRWRAPQIYHWDGVGDATVFGPDCMQKPFPGDAAPLGKSVSENCLFLNVWRSASPTLSKLPVVVWIYGGGFVNGGSSPSVYDGEAFARDGVMFVSFNYRLGRFGFFAHPALRAAHEGPSGNFAYMDQLAALKWVRRNIGKFGGDPDNVTIVGESAGGASALNLLLSPAARGLFARAVIMSGGGRSNFMVMRHLSAGTPDVPSAEAIGLNFARSVGIDGSDTVALQKLRALPADRVLGGYNMANLFAPPPSPDNTTYVGGPVLDGQTVVGDTSDLVKASALAPVPVMIGTTSHDLGLSAKTSVDAVFAPFGPAARRVREEYDPGGQFSLKDLRWAVAEDQLMTEPARFVARAVAHGGHNSYYYRFAYVASALAGKVDGAGHASDIPFAFDTVAQKYGESLTQKDKVASELFHDYIVNFSKNGNPNAVGLPHWKTSDDAPNGVMSFTPEATAVFERDPWADRLDAISAIAH